MTDRTSEHDRHIVVGIDGSPGSRTALAWAMTQAGLTGAAVEAVAAWQEPVMLLGSVSQHCVQHASCPVVVVPQ